MSKRFGAVVAVSGVLALVGCGASSATSFESAGGDPSSAGPSADPSADPASPSKDAPPQGQPQSGQLTAGVWDDNLNFDFFTRYAKAMQSRLGGLPNFSEQDRLLGRDRAFAPRGAAPRGLDLAIVFDTTGSMGDELAYVQSEFESIVGSLRAKFPGVAQRYSLVVYRDGYDQYTAKSVRFMTDASAFQRTMARESAGGGGDYPEAVERGLEEMVQLDWDQASDVAKVAFWVADAPHHGGSEVRVANAARQAAKMNLHVYPVAASGTDDRAEFTMRSVAQVTGGRFLFLTDDSGIGDTHAEPRIPCYFVTRLDHAIERMLEIELRGTRIDPPQDQIVRSVGTPVNGRCDVHGEQLACY
ncbi:MAG: VWA domain-containing protein [Myxococcales bacterium]|nr:VWA domain-containing protein [Myxococcales bacterium]